MELDFRSCYKHFNLYNKLAPFSGYYHNVGQSGSATIKCRHMVEKFEGLWR